MSFRLGISCQIKDYQIKINIHDSKHLILSKYYLYDAPQIMDIFKKSVLDLDLGSGKLKSRNMV